MAITPTPSESTPTYHPTPEQEERAAALRRFNRRFVYLPVGVVALIILALVILMLWGLLHPNITGTADFASGLADIIIIFTLMPFLLLCAIGPALAGFLIYRAQQRRQLSPEERRGRLRLLLWRLDRALATLQTQLRQKWLPQVATPVIKGHAIAAYIKAIFAYIQRILTRSES